MSNFQSDHVSDSKAISSDFICFVFIDISNVEFNINGTKCGLIKPSLLSSTPPPNRFNDVAFIVIDCFCSSYQEVFFLIL